MFRLSVVDHVRLNFGHAVQNYTVHAQAAERLARLISRMRMAVLGLLGLSAATVSTTLIATSRPLQIAAVVIAALALFAYAFYVAAGLEARLFAHRSCAHRLWIICERYRALLAEVQDGFVDRDTILMRRDELVADLHRVYQQVFPVDQPAYERVRQPAQGHLSDAEIDQFLPPSLRATAKPEEANPPVQH
jgi:hypothetical protein